MVMQTDGQDKHNMIQLHTAQNLHDNLGSLLQTFPFLPTPFLGFGLFDLKYTWKFETCSEGITMIRTHIHITPVCYQQDDLYN